MQPKAGVPPPQGDGDSVEEMLGAGGGVLGADPLSNGLPERADGGDRVLCQTSQRISDDGNEIHPCRSASCEVRCQFALDADPKGVARGEGSLSYGLLLEWGDNVDVQGGRTTTTPGGEEDVSWSGEGVGDQVGHLPRRGQGSGLGGAEEYVTDGIVACNPIPIAPTTNLVVAKGVRCAAAFWAGVGGAMKWNSQPVPQAAAELRRGGGDPGRQMVLH